MSMFPRCQQCGSIGWCNCGKESFKQRIEEDIKKDILKLDRYIDTYEGLMENKHGDWVNLKEVLQILGENGKI